ncbi:MAG: glycoside hydrolase family 3 C-terminal domain-containing protein [Lachnospiraceae bacterium]|nr:glycoside hydrolase family 3 C-terminal domain-containing protein [Lachnospiraceae bacterium]
MGKNVRWQRLKYLSPMPLGKDGPRVTGSKEHLERSKTIAKEGMVLLKNNNALPFETGTRLALLGKGVFDYVKGGGGSGDVTVAGTTNLYDGFKATGRVSVFEEACDFYKKDVEAQYRDGKAPGMTVEPELPEDILKRAAAFTDTAVIALCRFSGEGWDRKHEDFCLSEGEKKLVEKVKKAFKKVVVVINAGGQIETGWIKDDPLIDAALYAWQGGSEGGAAAAELLCGISTPSGKLADTFAYKLEDYPSTEGFSKSDAFVEYEEDIFVGYRYFETVPGAKDKVVYPFGYGLSYTTFAVKPAGVLETPEGLVFDFFVSNTGDREGKEVVELYFAAPKGAIDKPARVLCGFKKTRLLQPGDTTTVSISVDKKTLGFYDDLGNVQKSAWILEKGDYRFFTGGDVRSAREINYVYSVGENEVIEQCSEKMTPKHLKKRLTSDGSYADVPFDESAPVDDAPVKRIPLDSINGYGPSYRGVKGNAMFPPEKAVENKKSLDDVAAGKVTLDEFLEQFTDEDLMWLCGGTPNVGLANTCGFGSMPDFGIPAVMTADGPAGLRIRPECGVCTTALPCATLVACTWDPEAAYEGGALGGLEVKENNIGVWLTPAVNIHRNPLCGRNFEYYSEDPLLAGKIGAGTVKGIQSARVAATVKHFALNNKETNRLDSDSRATERAIREIYLRPFEIIAKESDPWCFMSSYNIINGRRASENKELLTDILRGEWGYEGLVMSDWWGHGEHCVELAAGNDIKMPVGYLESLEMGVKEGIICRDDLLRTAKRLMNMILKLD